MCAVQRLTIAVRLAVIAHPRPQLQSLPNLVITLHLSLPLKAGGPTSSHVLLASIAWYQTAFPAFVIGFGTAHFLFVPFMWWCFCVVVCRVVCRHRARLAAASVPTAAASVYRAAQVNMPMQRTVPPAPTARSTTTHHSQVSN